MGDAIIEERPKLSCTLTLINRLIVTGLLLLPFSTPASGNSIVISFGLPFLGMASLLIFILLLEGNLRLSTRSGNIFLIALLQVISIIVFTIISPTILPSMYRVFSNVVGFLIFTYIISLTSQTKIGIFIFDKIEKSISISGAIMASYLLITILLATSRYGFGAVAAERYVGGLMSLPWGASNAIAAALLIPLFVTVSRIKNNITKRRRSFFILAFIILVGIFSTMSRNSIIVTIFSLLILSFLSKTLKYSLTIVIIAGIAYLGITFFSLGEDINTIFSTRIANIEKIRSLNGRVDIWQENLAYIRDNPLKPIGYYGSIYEFGYSSHNFLLTTFMEQGFIGLLIMLCLFFYLGFSSLVGLFSSNQSVRTMAKFYFCGFVAIVLALQLEDANFTQQFIIYFWTFSALLISVNPVFSNHESSLNPAKSY